MHTSYEERFSGVLGSEYNLFERSIPWHEEFQNKISEEIKIYCFNIQGNEAIKVFEAGCGTGITTVRILGADKRIQVIALDNEDKTLKQAEEVLKDFQDRINFVKEDISKYLENIEENSLDIFASAYVIHNLLPEYREKMFREVSRVLKVGGLFINGDKYARNNNDQQIVDLEDQIKNFDIYDKMGRSDLKSEWIRHYNEDEKIKITENEQGEILKNFGFSNIKTVFRKRMEAIITAVKL